MAVPSNRPEIPSFVTGTEFARVVGQNDLLRELLPGTDVTNIIPPDLHEQAYQCVQASAPITLFGVKYVPADLDQDEATRAEIAHLQGRIEELSAQVRAARQETHP